MTNTTATRNHRSFPAPSGRSLKETASAKKSYENPLRIQPRVLKFDQKKNKGDELHFRILSLDPAQTRIISGYNIVKQNEYGTFNEFIHHELKFEHPIEVLKSNDLSGLIGTYRKNTKQEDGSNLESLVKCELYDMPESQMYRIPIFVYGYKRLSGSWEEVNDLFFWEITGGMWKQLLKLEETRGLDLKFGENTGKPDYDLILVREAAKGLSTYGLYGVQYEEGSGRNSVLSQTYNVSDEEALGADIWAKVLSKWGELQDSMDDFQSMDDVRYHLGTGKGKPALAQRPTMPGGESIDTPQPEEQVEEDTRRATTTRTRGSKPKAEEVDQPVEAAVEEDTNRSTAGDTAQTTSYFTRRKRS